MASKKKSKKARAKPKAKAKTKAKAKPKAAARAKPKARATAKPTVKPQTTRAELPMLDEAIEEPLLDTSGILRVKDMVARTQRDADEDERKQFSDPSLVIETERQKEALPSLFADEERRQKDEPSSEAPRPDHSPLFNLDDDDDDSN